MAAGAFSGGVIKVDANPAVYYSGQIISGSVIFDLDQPVNFSVLYINFLGEANVLWTETETETVNGMENKREVKYIGHEEYFNFNQPLAGGAGPSQLPSGHHTLPFRYQIPFKAPSTFKGEKGYISYSMTAHLIYPDQVTKEEIKKEFQVVAPLDLNLGSPSIKQPIDLEFEEVYGCECFCGSNPVTIRVRLPLSGYCPGQNIPVGVEVQNESNVEITKMTFQLVTKELYRSLRPVSEYIVPEEVLVTVKTGAVMANCKRNFTCNVPVPEMIAPFLENCGIIDVGYFFRITIKLSGCNDDLQDESELCLGLVPVSGSTDGEYQHPMAHSLPKGPIPVGDGPMLTVPHVAAAFTGSTTSLHRTQFSNTQTSPYPNNPPPYTSGNQPYPSANNFQSPGSMEMKPQPFSDYPIGFKAPDMPGNNAYPPPYPAQNFMPGVTGPSPGNTAQGYPQGAFVPSAPPPNM